VAVAGEILIAGSVGTAAVGNEREVYRHPGNPCQGGPMIKTPALLLLFVCTAWAQVPTMHIKLKNGTTASFPLQSINKLTFDTVASAVHMDRMRTVIDAFILLQNYPNPFNPVTTIEYRLEKPAEVDLSIVNVEGRCVRSYGLGGLKPGVYKSAWDGEDNRGLRVASGVYFYVLRVNRQVQTNKMILIR
jgi:hypothetical protein